MKRWLLLLLLFLASCKAEINEEILEYTMEETPETEPEEIIEETQEPIRYVAGGDSYTIGQGVTEEERWPNVLTKHLQEEGILIELVANPSATGRGTKGVIDRGLPVFQEHNATFGTLLIGVNDWVNFIPEETFRERLSIILETMQEQLGKKFIVITIPDFSAAPAGFQYAAGRNITEGIASFNTIIVQETQKRSIATVDIFELSQAMRTNRTLVARDGLHPSGEEYKRWEEVIFPVAYSLLTEPEQ